MLNIDYVNEGSLLDTIIVKADRLGMEDLVGKMHRGEITTLSAAATAQGELAVVNLTEDVKFQVSQRALEMLRLNKPCHDYIDLESGMTIMLSLNEYT